MSLGARAFDVLQALIERRERLVTKSELLDLVWPDVVGKRTTYRSRSARCASCSDRSRLRRFQGGATDLRFRSHLNCAMPRV